MHRVARILWFCSAVAVVAAAIWAWTVLPEQPATHFGADGTADGSMSRTGNLVFGLGLGAVFVLGLPLLMWALARGSGAGINIPRKDYWFAPDRVAATRSMLVDDMLVFAAGGGLFVAGVEAATVVANRRTPPSAGAEVWVLLAVFLAFVVGWVVHLLRRYGHPPEGDLHRPRPPAGDRPR